MTDDECVLGHGWEASPEDEVLAGHPVLRTNDPGLAMEALERVLAGVSIRLRPAGGRPLGMLMNVAGVGNVIIGYLRFGTEVHMVTGESESYFVNIPLRGRTLWRAGEFQVWATPAVAAVLNPGTRCEVIWDGGCAQLCVKVPSALLHHELERHLDREATAPLRFEPGADLGTPAALGGLAALRLVHDGLERPGGLLSFPLAAQTVENMLVNTLLLAQPHNYTAALTAPVRPGSSRTVQAAVELLEAHPERAWTVGELAREVHLSVRALQEAFARSGELSPMQYLRQVRLSRVHTDLENASPEGSTVAEIAARWGFTHHGRFAAVYRTRYGHSPANTLRN